MGAWRTAFWLAAASGVMAAAAPEARKFLRDTAGSQQARDRLLQEEHGSEVSR